ncbi:unnamed protein product [Soboliphyme baturini]|uniref:Transposase n=1 Tax=Soboliphyme baturini TaxID=241478 RepID=A0A183J1A7_9BILA|nr:unnamed protein product [Soboliphyme baturini]
MSCEQTGRSRAHYCDNRPIVLQTFVPTCYRWFVLDRGGRWRWLTSIPSSKPESGACLADQIKRRESDPPLAYRAIQQVAKDQGLLSTIIMNVDHWSSIGVFEQVAGSWWIRITA